MKNENPNNEPNINPVIPIDNANAPEPQPAASPTSPIEPGTKWYKRKGFLVGLLACVLIGGSISAWALLNKSATTSTQQTQAQTQATHEDEIKLQGYWLYKSDKDKQIYLFNAATNESKVYLKVAENEQVEVSPGGKQLARTRDNLVEIAKATDKPEFKQIYADSDKEIDVNAAWLPDNSGFIISGAKLTNPEARSEGYWVPRYVYTVTRIKADGSEPKKLFEYPVTWGGISIDGIDLKRDEIYYSESGEGGLRVALGLYRLSDGTKLKTYEGGENMEPLTVANGKAFKTNTIRDYSTNKEKAQIIEVDLDSGKEKVVYETLTTEGRNFTRPGGGDFSEGISVRTLKASSDGVGLYFDEIHNLEKSITKLKVMNLSDSKVKEIYTPSMTGSYITVETLAANVSGVIGRVSCGGCSTAEHDKLGNEYVFIDPSSYKWRLIQKTASNDYLDIFQPILLQE